VRDPFELHPPTSRAYGRVPVGKGQAAAGFNVVEAAAFLAAGFFTTLPAFFAAGLLTFFLLLYELLF
jgi:predicted phage tail protein